MGLDSLAWSGVQGFLTEFFGSGIVASGLQAVIALGIGGFALKVLVDAFRK